MDHPKKTKLTSLKIHRSKQEVSAQRQEPQSHATASTSKNTVRSEHCDNKQRTDILKLPRCL